MNNYSPNKTFSRKHVHRNSLLRRCFQICENNIRILNQKLRVLNKKCGDVLKNSIKLKEHWETSRREVLAGQHKAATLPPIFMIRNILFVMYLSIAASTSG